MANIVRSKNPGSLQKFLICATKGENWERKDMSLNYLRKTRKWTNIKRCMKKAKENCIREQCRKTEENLRKNNSKRANHLVKDLTTVKQGKATAVHDRSGKCLTEERQILNRLTEYCSALYNYKANGEPSVPPHPSQRSWGCGTIIEEKEFSWSQQHPRRTGPSRGEDVITALTTICNRIWQTGEWPTP